MKSATSQQRGRGPAWLWLAGVVTLLVAQVGACVPDARLHEEGGQAGKASGGGPDDFPIGVSADIQGDVVIRPNTGLPNTGLVTTEAGGRATFTVSLKRAPTSNVALVLTSSSELEGRVSPISLTFSPENYAAPQRVVVTGVNDSLQDHNQSYFIRTAPLASDDSSYDGLDPLDVEVVNVDDDTAGFLVGPVAGLVTSESGTEAVFSVVLNHAPTAIVEIPLGTDNPAEGVPRTASLTFTQVNWSAPQLVVVDGVEDQGDADGPQSYRIVLGPAQSTDGEYNLLDPSDVELVNRDNDTPGITALVDGRSLTANELEASAFTSEDGGQATVQLVLNSPPTAAVMIEVGTSDEDEAVTYATSVIFTPENWAAPQTIILAGVDDTQQDGDQPYLLVTEPASSKDTGYADLDGPDVLLFNRDDDTSAVRITAARQLSTTERGGSATFEVALGTKPSDAVQLHLISRRTDEGAPSHTSLTFTELNWRAPQVVTVTGQDDEIADGNQPYVIEVAVDPETNDAGYLSLLEQQIALTNLDDDTAGIVLVPMTPLLTSETGQSASIAVHLAWQPTADVALAVSSSDTTEGTSSPSVLTFTPQNYATAQTVTVYGEDERTTDGWQPYRILMGPATSDDRLYRGLTGPSIWLRNRDDETAGISTRAATGFVSERGGTATFSIVLDSQPMAEVDIAVASSSTSEGTVSPSEVRFTPEDWQIPQRVSVHGVDDTDSDGDERFGVLITPALSEDPDYNGLTTLTVPLLNHDDDGPAASAKGLILSGPSGNVDETGSEATFAVSLSEAPSADVRIPLSSSTPGECLPTPNELVLTPENWMAPQVVTVQGVDDTLNDGTQYCSILLGPFSSADSDYADLATVEVEVANLDDD